MNFIDRHCFILLIEGELIYFSRLAPFLNAGGRIGIWNLEWKGQPMNQPVEKFTAYFLSIFILLSVASRDPRAATIAEVTSKIASLSLRDGKEILINGAKEEGQKFLGATLGKGIAMKGVQSRYKEFQIQPDFVVSPVLGPKLKRYIEDFKKIFGIF